MSAIIRIVNWDLGVNNSHISDMGSVSSLCDQVSDD